MTRLRCLALMAAFIAGVATTARAADGDWATIKGRVTFPKDLEIPKRGELKVTQDKDHCLKDGPILDETVIVNPKNRGVKNVVVWLRPDDMNPRSKIETIHPDDAKRKPAEIVIDQPCCMFVKRVTIARPGDTLVVNNPAPVPHNFFWSSGNNGEFNITVPKQQKWTMPQKLADEGPPIQYKCTIHGWMTGYVRIFDHPYVAVTDENGNFEIKNAPVGDFRVVLWHETGFKGGARGRFGEPLTIKGPTTETELEFDVRPDRP